MPRNAKDDVELADEGVDFTLDTDTDTDGEPMEAQYDGTQELRLDLSQEELTSEARVYEPLPAGAYIVCITEGNVAYCGPNSKNPGKPYWRLKLTVQEGPGTKPELVGRNVYTNVMLFKGAGYSWAQLGKALGMDPNVVPPMSRVVATGEKVGIALSKQKDTWKIREEGWTAEDGPVPMKNEVKGFMPAGRVGTKLQGNAMPNHGGRVTLTTCT
jgi:hypothetical protein